MEYIGSWEMVWESSKKDLEGNYKEGNVILENTKIPILGVRTD